jgi:Family of unknown function (DUF6510)
MPDLADRSGSSGGLTMALESRHVDGNAVAGAFAEVFGIDVTTVVLACVSCGATSLVAENLAYADGPGIVLRCPTCTEITARLVRRPDDVLIDLRGSVHWRIPDEMRGRSA